jgi:hypothetical protein
LTPATSSDAGDFFTFTPGICLLITDESMKTLAEEIAGRNRWKKSLEEIAGRNQRESSPSDRR